jgi:hypothetical protein
MNTEKHKAPELRKTDISSSVYLLPVPNSQKEWFKLSYDTIKLEVSETEIMDYSMLENNLFGINERFINWKSDLNGLVDDYLENNLLQPDKTSFIRDCLICVLEDCKDFEYFEMAHNLNLILNSFEVALSAYERGIADYYNKKGSSDVI